MIHPGMPADWEAARRLLEGVHSRGMIHALALAADREAQVRFHRALLKRERELDTPVMAAVRGFSSSGQVPRMPDNAAAGLFFLRADAALHLLEFLCNTERGGAEPRVPAAPDAQEAFLLWLLEDWWWHAGRELWLAWLAERERAAD